MGGTVAHNFVVDVLRHGAVVQTARRGNHCPRREAQWDDTSWSRSPCLANKAASCTHGTDGDRAEMVLGLVLLDIVVKCELSAAHRRLLIESIRGSGQKNTS